LSFYILKVHLRQSSKIKNHKEVSKQKSRFFLLFLSGSVQIIPDPYPLDPQDLRKGELFVCLCGQVKNAVGGKHNKRQQHSARQDLIEFTIKTETEEFEGEDQRCGTVTIFYGSGSDI
jgi:hypothetical protein